MAALACCMPPRRGQTTRRDAAVSLWSRQIPPVSVEAPREDRKGKSGAYLLQYFFQGRLEENGCKSSHEGPGESLWPGDRMQLSLGASPKDGAWSAIRQDRVNKRRQTEGRALPAQPGKVRVVQLPAYPPLASEGF